MRKLSIIYSSLLLAELSLVTTSAAITLPYNSGNFNTTATVTTSYDTNVFSETGQEGDFLYSGRVDAQFDREAAYSLRGRIGLDWNYFQKNSTEDSFDATIELGLETNWGAREFEFSVKTQNERDDEIAWGKRINRENRFAQWKLTGPLYGRFEIVAGASFEDLRYASDGFQNLTTWTGNLAASHPLTPTIHASFGTYLRASETNLLGRSIDRGITTGVSRQLFPKVKGTVLFGWNDRDHRTAGIETMTANIDLTWQPVDRLSLDFLAGREIRTVPGGETVISTHASLISTFDFRSKWSVQISGGNAWTDFITENNREDQSLRLTCTLNRSINSHLNVSLSGTFIHNDSSQSSARFDRGIWALNVSCKL